MTTSDFIVKMFDGDKGVGLVSSLSVFIARVLQNPFLGFIIQAVAMCSQ